MKQVLTLLLFLAICGLITGQGVAISGFGLTPHNSALLEVQSTSKGILIPRMSTTQRNAIANPAHGLLVFDAILSKFFYYSGGWKEIRSDLIPVLADNDNDTKIQVEESPDENIIRFDIDGLERWRMEEYTFVPTTPGGDVYIGRDAGLNFIGFSTGNVGIGRGALYHHVLADDIVAIGDSAMYFSSSQLFDGHRTTALGAKSLYHNTQGQGNVAVGYKSMYSNSGGDWNTISGYQASYSSISSSYNTISGYHAGFTGNGSENTIYGARSFMNNTSNNGQITAVGFQAMENSANAPRNTAVGVNALRASNGFFNTAVGYNAAESVVQGYNTAIGAEALKGGTEGSGNTACGFRALATVATGDNNTAVGTYALENNTANGNLGIGYWALRLNTTGAFNTAVGGSSLRNNVEGAHNTALGSHSLNENVDGSHNIGIGYVALSSNISGDYNLAIGNSALNLCTGNRNVAVGAVALTQNVTGEKNVAVGVDAGQQNTGSNNVFMGFEAGRSNTGNSNVFLGYQAGRNMAGDNLLVIENSLSTTPLVQGNFSTNVFAINGTMGVGVTGTDCRLNVAANAGENGLRVRIDGATKFLVHSNGGLLIGVNGTPPSDGIQIYGDASKPGGGLWLANSDRRLKTNIQNFTDGISVIKNIRPVRFHYTEESGLPHDKAYIGVIAQELQEIAPHMVHESKHANGETYLAVDFSAATYMLINAVQEQQEQIDALTMKLEAIEGLLSQK